MLKFERILLSFQLTLYLCLFPCTSPNSPMPHNEACLTVWKPLYYAKATVVVQNKHHNAYLHIWDDTVERSSVQEYK